MKIIILMLALTPTIVNAKAYKCEANGKVSYQSTPCQKQGNEFLFKHEISKERQKEALATHHQRLDDEREAFKQVQIEYDKERLIRAEEAKADASYYNAFSSAQQARQLAIRNRIELLKIAH